MFEVGDVISYQRKNTWGRGAIIHETGQVMAILEAGRSLSEHPNYSTLMEKYHVRKDGSFRAKAKQYGIEMMNSYNTSPRAKKALYFIREEKMRKPTEEEMVLWNRRQERVSISG